MTAEIVDSPQFAAETDQLLKLFAKLVEDLRRSQARIVRVVADEEDRK